ncbi:hypothetical protein BD310DRAFT_923014, partial [Dichomitus squalens]
MVNESEARCVPFFVCARMERRRIWLWQGTLFRSPRRRKGTKWASICSSGATAQQRMSAFAQREHV